MKNKINVLLSRHFASSDIEYLKEKVDSLAFFCPDSYEENEFFKYVESLDEHIHVVLGPPPERNILELIKDNLIFVQVPWTGVESIDFTSCEEFGVQVCNSHGNANCVAEMAVSLLLSCSKAIPYHDSELRKGLWHRPGDKTGFLPPDEFRGSTVGLFGYGAINKKVAKMLQGFGVSIITCTRKLNNCSLISDSYLIESDFDEFLRQCDYLVVGAPLTEQTAEIFSYDSFNLMKASSFFINVSRGGLVSDKGLYKALELNVIRGAAIDTWNKPPARNSEVKLVSSLDFSSLTNIVMSPHRAGFLRDELPHLTDVVENFERVISDKSLINLIDYKNGY